MTDVMTPEQATKLLEANRQERVIATSERIKAVLAETQCELVAVPTITPDGRVIAVVQIAAR